MSETEKTEGQKRERTVAEIQGEYTQLCAKAGHIQYSIKQLEKDLEIVNSSLRDLNIEAAQVSQRQQEEAAKAKEADAKLSLVKESPANEQTS